MAGKENGSNIPTGMRGFSGSESKSSKLPHKPTIGVTSSSPDLTTALKLGIPYQGRGSRKQ
jgi:hypothetical protein